MPKAPLTIAIFDANVKPAPVKRGSNEPVPEAASSRNVNVLLAVPVTLLLEKFKSTPEETLVVVIVVSAVMLIGLAIGALEGDRVALVFKLPPANFSVPGVAVLPKVDVPLSCAVPLLRVVSPRYVFAPVTSNVWPAPALTVSP